MPTEPLKGQSKPHSNAAFEQWLDGEQVDSKTRESWQHDESLKDLYDTGLYLKHQAECFEQQEVPNWNREATFAGADNKKDWFSWFNVSPALSMAMSIVAICMVLFKVEVQIGDNGLLVTFAQDHKQQMMQQMDAKLAQFGRDQQLIMANYVDDIQQQQNQEMTQLASYLVQSSRSERREDMQELVQYLNARRDDDLSLQKHQIDKILYQFNQQNTPAALRKTSFEPSQQTNTHQEEK